MCLDVSYAPQLEDTPSPCVDRVEAARTDDTEPRAAISMRITVTPAGDPRRFR
jgi:hypothetical protein